MQQSPRWMRYFSLRSSTLIASHASLPTFSAIACTMDSVSSRFVQRAPLQVSVISTVSSQSRWRPMFSGEGPPAAAQLPRPCCFSCTSTHLARVARE